MVLCSSAVRPVFAQDADDGAESQTTADQDGATALPLGALVAAALENWPRLRAAQQRLRAAEAQLDEAIFSPFFQFNASGGLAVAPEARGNPIFSPDSQLPLGNQMRPVVSVAVSGAVPLYTFGKLSGARDAARAGVAAAEHGGEAATQQLQFDVRRAYYTVQFALDIQQMIEEGEGRLEDAVEALERRIDNGDPDVNEHDRWRLSTTIADILSRKSEAIRLERTARRALGTLTGITNPQVPECPIEAVELPERPLTEYRSQALAGRPDIQMVHAGIRALRAQRTIAQAQYFPDLALGLNASYSFGPGITDQNNPFVTDSANFQSLGAGLVFRWNLDFVGNRMREQRASAQLLEAEARADEAQAGVEIELATIVESLENGRRRVDAWRRGHRDARSWFVASVGAYEVGALDARDFIDSVRTYFTARTNHLNAIFDFNQAAASLSRAVGGEVLTDGAWDYGCSGADVEVNEPSAFEGEGE